MKKIIALILISFSLQSQTQIKLKQLENATAGSVITTTGTGTPTWSQRMSITSSSININTPNSRFTFQDYPGDVYPALYMGTVTPTTINYQILQYAGIDYFNASGSLGTMNLLTNHQPRLVITGTTTSGHQEGFEFLPANNTTQTAGFQIFGYLLRGATRQWNTGNMAVQKELEVQAPTWSAVGASTFNVGYNGYFRNPTVSTNLTVPNLYSLGAEGNVNIEGRLNVGNTSTTVSKSHSLNVTGGAAISTTLQLGNNTSTLTGGNSGTVAVVSDVYYTTASTFATISTFSANTTYYFGVGLASSVANTTANTRRFVIPFNATLVGYAVQLQNGVRNSIGTNTLSIRQNNSTNTQLTTLAQPANFGAGVFTDAYANNLSQSFTAGDTYELLLTTPSFSVNPQNVNCMVVLTFARR